MAPSASAIRACVCSPVSPVPAARQTAACAPSPAASPMNWWTRRAACSPLPIASALYARATPTLPPCLGELLDAGASALKRRAPCSRIIVPSIVDVYRRQLDDALASRTANEAEREARARQLKRCFNRDFTTEYQHGASGDEMMSYERSNNRGQLVGEVIASRPTGRDVRGLHPDDRRRRAAIARIHLFEPVDKGDLLELRHDDTSSTNFTTLAPVDASSPAKPSIATSLAPCQPAAASA